VTAPALLLTFAVIGGCWAGRWLDQARWPARAPRLGIWAWAALSASTLAAAVLAGLALAVPSVRLTPALADLLHACWALIRAHYATPGGAVAGVAGLILAGSVSARLLVRLAAENLGARRARRSHRQRLLLLGHPAPQGGLMVLPCAEPAVYCLPGRPGIVVCTSAALEQLKTDELQAVLAHEQAHLRGRHHRLLTVAGALRSAFPFVTTFRLAEQHLAVLVEMRADDVARGARNPRALGSALVKLAGAVTPQVALGANGAGLLARVHRLASGTVGVPARTATGVAVLGLLVLAAPLLIALGPAAVAVALDYCPPGFPG